jgi:ABC-type phosphate transport system auxiliary subunit
VHQLLPLLGILSVFGMPTAVLVTHLRLRHREKMRQLDGMASASQVAALEVARRDLEARMRTLETIVTAGDHDLEARLRRLTAIEAANANERQQLLGSAGADHTR